MPDPAVSFEFFPPGDEAMAQQLWQSVQRLAPLQPSFVSVTYGADGSTRTRTHEFVQRVLRETDLRVAPHLTCVGASRAEVLQIAQDLLATRRAALGGAARRCARQPICPPTDAICPTPTALPTRPTWCSGSAASREFRNVGGGVS